MDIDQIISRIKELTGAVTQKDVAETVGLQPGNFSAKKKNKSLHGDILLWAIEHDVDLNYLFYGKKSGIEGIDMSIYEMGIKANETFKAWAREKGIEVEETNNGLRVVHNNKNNMDEI